MVSTTSLRCRRVIDFNMPLCTHNVERIVHNIVEIKPGLFFLYGKILLLKINKKQKLTTYKKNYRMYKKYITNKTSYTKIRKK